MNDGAAERREKGIQDGLESLVENKSLQDIRELFLMVSRTFLVHGVPFL